MTISLSERNKTFLNSSDKNSGEITPAENQVAETVFKNSDNPLT